jgi:hypothetical protein
MMSSIERVRGALEANLRELRTLLAELDRQAEVNVEAQLLRYHTQADIEAILLDIPNYDGELVPVDEPTEEIVWLRGPGFTPDPPTELYEVVEAEAADAAYAEPSDPEADTCPVSIIVAPAPRWGSVRRFQELLSRVVHYNPYWS